MLQVRYIYERMLQVKYIYENQTVKGSEKTMISSSSEGGKLQTTKPNYRYRYL
jgi:hypothetical protein